MKRSVNYIVVFLLFICSFLNINASNKIKNPDYIEYEKLSRVLYLTNKKKFNFR